MDKKLQQQLHKRTEAFLNVDCQDALHRTLQSNQKLVQELQTYQIELELQNDELRQSQLKLIEANERYVELYDFAPVGYLTLNEKGIILEANLTLADMLGELRTSLIKHPLSPFLFKDDQDRYYLYRKNLLKTKVKQVCEVRFSCRMQKTLWVRLDGIVVADNHGQKNLRLIISDITEQKQVEVALQESEEKFNLICDSAKDAVLMQNHQRKISYWNDAAEHLFGYSKNEALDQELRFLLSPQDYKKVYNEDFAKYKTTDQGPVVGQIIELSATRKNGSEFPVELSISAIKIKKKWNEICIIRDITERIRAEQVLKQSQVELGQMVEQRTRDLQKANEQLQLEVVERTHLAQQLQEENRRKDEFLALLAHELRNPLAPMVNGIELIQRASDNTEIREQACRIIMKYLKIMVRLIDELLDISRIVQNKITLRKETINLTTIIEDVIQINQSLINEKKLQLDVSLPAGVIFLNADTTRLHQAVSNLLNNAAKFTPDEGKIWLKATLDNDIVEIYLRDTGIGIPATMLPDKIFEKFTQVNPATQCSQGGLGLGLALAKDLIERHDGTIRAFSAGKGQGCEFLVRLPTVKA